MVDEQSSQDPLFIKITEVAGTGGARGELQVTPVQIKHGDSLTISSRQYTVEHVRTPGGAFAIRNKKDDLRANVIAFDLLRRSGALPADCEIDDLCLRNPINGDCMIELCHDATHSSSDDPVIQSGKRHFFARLDSSMVNPHLKDVDFDDIVVRASPCMFGTRSALLVTRTGGHISLTERSMAVDEPVEGVILRREPSLYEREILRRMLGVIALFARSGKVGRLVAAFPRGAYYSFPVAAAARGMISPATMLTWFDGVDRRVAMLRERFVGDLGSAAPSLKVEQYSFMDSACPILRGFFRGRLNRGTEPFDVQALLADVIEAMEAADPFVRHVFSLGVPKPATFRELADLTYAATNLVEMAEQSPRRVLVIGVYDPTENILWNVVRKLRYRGMLEPRGLYSASGPTDSRLDSLSYVGVMPLEQVLFEVSPEYEETHLGGASRLYAVQDSLLTTVDMHMISRIFAMGDAQSDSKD